MLKILIILTALFIAPVWAQDLPDGPGRPTVVRICSGCHGPEMFSGYVKPQADWEPIIADMLDKGLHVSDADYNTVLNYLSTCLGPAPPKIEINKVPACMLTRALGIPQKQANAIVDYRDKNGSFKDLNAVKNVEGVDAGALDKNQSTIAF